MMREIDTYAQVLADATIDTRSPFTIGIFGEWGHGKNQPDAAGRTQALRVECQNCIHDFRPATQST
jgi:hypothetical protein